MAPQNPALDTVWRWAVALLRFIHRAEKKLVEREGKSAISVGLQKRVEQLVGPLHERRASKERRQVKGITRGRRESD